MVKVFFYCINLYLKCYKGWGMIEFDGIKEMYFVEILEING